MERDRQDIMRERDRARKTRRRRERETYTYRERQTQEHRSQYRTRTLSPFPSPPHPSPPHPTSPHSTPSHLTQPPVLVLPYTCLNSRASEIPTCFRTCSPGPWPSGEEVGGSWPASPGFPEELLSPSTVGAMSSWSDGCVLETGGSRTRKEGSMRKQPFKRAK